jgi:predicted DNA-binding transcriptional regulator AlpA
MVAERRPAGDEFVTIQEISERIGRGEATAWALVKRANLPRYRLPGRGKTTYFRRSDVEDAYNTPVPIETETTKKADPLAA